MAVALEEKVGSEVEEKGITLFGFQAGPQGFCRFGLEKPGKDRLMLVISGGRGACKTFALAVRIVVYLLTYPGAIGMIIGLTDRNITAGLLPQLRKVFKAFGLKPGEHWQLNKQQGNIRFLINDSELFLRTAENIIVLPGASLAFLALDEAWAMDEEIFTTMFPAVRQPGYPHQVLLASTPSSPTHWVRKYLYPKEYSEETGIEVQPLKQWSFIEYVATTEEAARYPEFSGITQEAYEAMLAMYGGPKSALARQQLFGEWVSLEGMQFTTWDANYHVKPVEQWIGSPKYIVAGVDFGYDHPSAILVVGADDSGKRRYILDEWRKRKCSQEELIFTAQRLMEERAIDVFCADSSDPRWITAMRQAGLPVKAAKKDRSFGFTACAASLASKVDGQQGFFTAPHCKGFRSEIENHPRIEDDGHKKLKNDDLIACWRYAEVEIALSWATTIPSYLYQGFSFKVV